MYAEVEYQATWLGGGEVGGAVQCTLDAVDEYGEIVESNKSISSPSNQTP